MPFSPLPPPPVYLSHSIYTLTLLFTMGVKGLLKELPGGNAKECQRVGFSKLEVLIGKKRRPADIDTGTLIFVCAL